ncbi:MULTISPECIES: cell division protein SepF [Alteribacter]|uniref:Cell division protein SepF n=1 Tax=Alteribacter keqinensis TaxID=2483800 RepID=A0A3M7TZ17_9BACI|nr:MULTISPECIES: cell division protein SepF [Alteribacter]MBM7095851.1 cell division protein SepF [Alteribacter salitolerans]RNA69675.1 cell division protein SepF [Alteribacter keqinensis]
MGIKTKLKRFFEMEDEYVEEQVSESYDEPSYPQEREREERPSYDKKEKGNVVSLASIQQSNSAKVMLIEPHSYDECQDIADHLKNRKAVVINLQRIHNDQAKRVVDFLSGTVYAIGGDIQKLGMNIFLCTPDNVDVTGSISEIFSDDRQNF